MINIFFTLVAVWNIRPRKRKGLYLPRVMKLTKDDFARCILFLTNRAGCGILSMTLSMISLRFLLFCFLRSFFFLYSCFFFRLSACFFFTLSGIFSFIFFASFVFDNLTAAFAAARFAIFTVFFTRNFAFFAIVIRLRMIFSVCLNKAPVINNAFIVDSCRPYLCSFLRPKRSR